MRLDVGCNSQGRKGRGGSKAANAAFIPAGPSPGRAIRAAPAPPAKSATNSSGQSHQSANHEIDQANHVAIVTAGHSDLPPRPCGPDFSTITFLITLYSNHILLPR